MRELARFQAPPRNRPARGGELQLQLANSRNGILELYYYRDTSLDMYISATALNRKPSILVAVVCSLVLVNSRHNLNALKTFRIFSLIWKKMIGVPKRGVLVHQNITPFCREIFCYCREYFYGKFQVIIIIK